MVNLSNLKQICKATVLQTLTQVHKAENQTMFGPMEHNLCSKPSQPAAWYWITETIHTCKLSSLTQNTNRSALKNIYVCYTTNPKHYNHHTHQPIGDVAGKAGLATRPSSFSASTCSKPVCVSSRNTFHIVLNTIHHLPRVSPCPIASTATTVVYNVCTNHYITSETTAAHD